MLTQCYFSILLKSSFRRPVGCMGCICYNCVAASFSSSISTELRSSVKYFLLASARKATLPVGYAKKVTLYYPGHLVFYFLHVIRHGTGTKLEATTSLVHAHQSAKPHSWLTLIQGIVGGFFHINALVIYVWSRRVTLGQPFPI